MCIRDSSFRRLYLNQWTSSEAVSYTHLDVYKRQFLGRVVDAIADPIIARWSDNHSGHLGRRIPFMLYSGILYTAVFIALFYPPATGESPLNSIYLTLMLGIYFALFTAYVCPHLALLPELARSNKDRVDLSTWKAVFSILGVAGAAVAGGMLIDSIGNYGMIWVMGGVGLVMLLSLIHI